MTCVPLRVPQCCTTSEMASFRDRRVLITGGAGFIGSHLAESLVRDGAKVSILDNLDDFYPQELKQQNLSAIRELGHFDFYWCDVRRDSDVKTVFAEVRPQIVIHLAAHAGVSPSLKAPRDYEDVNVGGTIAVLESCREYKIGRFIFASSSSVYGASNALPFSEDHATAAPVSPYGATKVAGEVWTATYSRLYGIESICLRIFSAYGPRQRPDLAIHKFFSLIEAGLPLPIYGDGDAARDYTYVDDVVAGIVGALSYEPTRARGAALGAFNIGGCKPIAVRELVTEIESLVGKAALPLYKPARLGDAPMTWANISKARRFLNYSPRVSLREGLKRFSKWYRSRQQIVRNPSDWRSHGLEVRAPRTVSQAR
jgi:UDP-glucuronate 4-epimerase